MMVRTRLFTIYDALNHRAVPNIIGHVFRSPRDSVIIPQVYRDGILHYDQFADQKFSSLSVCIKDADKRSTFLSKMSEKYPDKKIRAHEFCFTQNLYRFPHNDSENLAARVAAKALDHTTSNEPVARDNYRGRNLKMLIEASQRGTTLLKNIYYQSILRVGYCAYCPVHYYLILPSNINNYLQANKTALLNKFRSTTVIFNALFDIEYLDSFEAVEDFGLKKQATLHLTSLMPKLDVLDDLGADKLLEFYVMISQVMTHRRRILIDAINNWYVNGSECMRHLGIDESVRVGDIGPDQYLKLFKQLRDSPEYEQSNFKLCYEQNGFVKGSNQDMMNLWLR